MASVKDLAISDHTMTDLNDLGPDRIDLHEVRGALPLEIQEHIITSGPCNPEQDRVTFLCLCALVCKDWLARSRSALALKVTIDSSSKSQSFFELVKNPNTTLTHSIKRLDGINYEGLIIAGPYLPSAEELTILGRDKVGVAELLQLLKHSMPSVRFLSLKEGVFGSTDDFLAIFTFFPFIHSLEISYSMPLNTSNDGVLQTFGGPVEGLTELVIEIHDDWHIRLLSSILALLQGLQKLQIRDTLRYPDVVATWAIENSLTIRPEIEVSFVLQCSGRDEYELSIDEDCEKFFSMFDSLELVEPHLQHLEQLIPLWISYGSGRLKRVTIASLDYEFFIRGLDVVDWTALSSSLGAAKQLTDVRFVRWANPPRIASYIKTLSVLAHPQFSLSVQMSLDPDSVEQLVV